MLIMQGLEKWRPHLAKDFSLTVVHQPSEIEGALSNCNEAIFHLRKPPYTGNVSPSPHIYFSLELLLLPFVVTPHTHRPFYLLCVMMVVIPNELQECSYGVDFEQVHCFDSLRRGQSFFHTANLYVKSKQF